VAVLLALALLGQLAWSTALIAGAAVLLATLALLWHHFRHMGNVARYMELLRGNAGGTLPAPPSGSSPLLAPGLDETLVQTTRERQRRRRELEAAIAGNEAILSNLPDPLLLLDRAHRVLRANPAAIELFGDGLEGRDLVAVIRDPILLEAAEAAIAGEEGRVVEVTLRGEVDRNFSARLVPLSTPALDGTVAILALHDLTSMYRAERMRADFVANASHELRTPLSSLVGFIETLRGPAAEDSEAQQRFLSIMEEQATRMSRLVEDLLSLSRIEMQEHTPPKGETDLAELLETLTAALDVKAREKDMTLSLEVEGRPRVIGQKDELAQVFQNLIENALKYGREGTEVTVTLRTAGPGENPELARLRRRAAVISVRDRGEGIAREHLPRLTERFYRVDTARSRKLGGTGLGLAIVKHIVNRHRGQLLIDSEVGAGSTFTVHLPTAERPVAEDGAEAESADAPRRAAAK
jgi:two-component system phosphate regulon sensor histidine kinase PhoR